MPLTLQYCSDLHLEFDLNRKRMAKCPLAVSGDVLLLAGDIVPFTQIKQHSKFFDFCADNYKAAYWIPGNHEYYHADIADRSGAVHEAIRDNVFLVNDTTITIEDTDIICATLWSRISPANEWDITRLLSDFKLIKNNGHRLNSEAYNILHAQSLEYIQHAVATSKAKHKVVMTHHVPTFMNYPEQYKGDALNEAFATELHDYIEASDITCWIYGHHHSNIPAFKIGNTWMLTNQLGYVQHGEHTTFAGDRTVTLSAVA